MIGKTTFLLGPGNFSGAINVKLPGCIYKTPANICIYKQIYVYNHIYVHIYIYICVCHGQKSLYWG